MRFQHLCIALAIGALSPCASYAAQPAATDTGSITRAGTEPSAVGPAAYFTGPVRIDMVWPSDASKPSWPSPPLRREATLRA